ncbi:MAG: hypothetical protein ACPHGV_08315 [Synechococcus sp.]
MNSVHRQRGGKSLNQSLRLLMQRHGLLERLEQLQMLLSVQIETLPLGNESWLATERELVAVERALERIPSLDG